MDVYNVNTNFYPIQNGKHVWKGIDSKLIPAYSCAKAIQDSPSFSGTRYEALHMLIFCHGCDIYNQKKENKQNK